MASSKRSAHNRKGAAPSVEAELTQPPVPSDCEQEEPKSLLYVFLLGSVLSPGAFFEGASGYNNIPEENNPRPLQQRMGDKAEYWVNGFGDILHIKFVARFYFHGQFSCLGPYFNLFDSGIYILNLKKTRAQFELHFLAPDDEDSCNYPPEALEMSCRVLDMLSALTTAVEDRRNVGIPEADRPAVSPFLCENFQGLKDCYLLAIQSEPLFKDLPKEGSATMPRISRQDIGKSAVLLSPSKAKQLAQACAAAMSSRAANTATCGGNVVVKT
ncbi:hypothetical protein CY34DRAFT_15699 [Suillus luteus UH-Slu-Lm8-n1]|uniref:Uncharacterized protein n=1 Tax=Suillus luteus UH-Slu-Lm8-n1 TaxID=930992 RepID=A0A0D0AH23_9AGAM|nr:hypothetical protein CY34DRAFT_15699 [Suillus luteus UH-Slu-Lm8-n1]